MANPLNALNKVDRRTRLAVIGGGGVVLGVIAWRRRQATAPTNDDAAPAVGTTIDQTQPENGVSGYTPIVVSGGSNANAINPSDVVTATTNGFGTIIDSLTGVIGTVGDNLTATVGANTQLGLGSLALAGEVAGNSRDMTSRLLDIASSGALAQIAAGHTVDNPSLAPVVNVTIPAPVAAAPAASTSQNTAPSHNPTFNKQNKGTGQWYKDTIASSAGTDSNGNKYKKGDSLNVYENGRVVKD